MNFFGKTKVKPAELIKSSKECLLAMEKLSPGTKQLEKVFYNCEFIFISI